MARPKKNNTEILVGILDGFWQEEACGDLSRLKCSELEIYARKKGVSALAYDFRRDREVRRRMDEIRTGCVAEAGRGSLAYKTMDIDALLNNCKTVQELKECLRGMDSYWKDQYEKLMELETAQRQRNVGKGDETGEKLALMARVSALEAENRRIKAQNIRMNSMLKKYLYPALAESLLKDEGLPVADSETIDMSKAAEMIDGRRPEPFQGRQEKEKEKLRRQEAILEQMKKAVKDGE